MMIWKKNDCQDENYDSNKRGNTSNEEALTLKFLNWKHSPGITRKVNKPKYKILDFGTFNKWFSCNF